LSNAKHAGSRGYYQDIVPGFEYMDVMEHVLGFDGVVAHLRGQIFKYSFRLGKKDKASSESEKISWYAARLDDTIKRYEANDGSFPKQNPLIQALIEQLREEYQAEIVERDKAAKKDPIMNFRPGKK
jgi:hypothetical protein